MAANSNVRLCLDAVASLEQILNEARKNIFRNDVVTVNREDIRTEIQNIRDNLPSALKTAQEYIDEIESIRTQAQREIAAERNKATQQAERLVLEGQAHKQELETKAADTVRQAQLQAQTIVDNAQREAAQIREEAERQAQAAIARDEITRRAQVAADELRERTESEVAALRGNTFDYLNQIMGDAEQRLAKLSDDIHTQRGELNSHR